MNLSPTERFSSRVENYRKYRPGYPPELITFLQEACSLTPASVIADVGSGTGILTEMFLNHGNVVFAVEPNREMRNAAEQTLAKWGKFHSVNGTAEATALDDASVDFVTAGQAFHWFKRGKAREEFLRILKPCGWVVLIWNDRRTDTTPFLRAYEELLHKFGTDYAQVNHRHIDEGIISSFFGPGGVRHESFLNAQVFDYDGMKGRLLSSSYVPEAGDPKYEPMLEELDRIYVLHHSGGKVAFEYDTVVYAGQLSAP